jgi:HEAT repeat protein
MDFSEFSSNKTSGTSSEPRFGLHVGTLLAILTIMALGFWGFHEYFSPRRTWRRAIHDPSTLPRVWAEVEREHVIEGLDPSSTIQEVFQAMEDPDPAIRGWAVWSVPSLEADPKLVIDRLAGMLGDQDLGVRIKVAEALGQIFKRGKGGRPEALGALKIALKDANEKVRKAAVGSVGQVVYEGGPSSDPLRSGQKDDPALGMIEARLEDPDMAVKVEAAFVLGCNDRGSEAVPMLVKFLKAQPVDEPLNYVANRAFMALTILAVRSQAAVDFLSGEMAVDRESYPDRPRDALAWAARQGSEPHLWVRKRAREALKSDDPVLKVHSAFLLFDIGLGVEALDTLVEALYDDSIDVRVRAVEAIGDIGESDVRAMNALQGAINDPDIEVRTRALAALEAIELEKMK